MTAIDVAPGLAYRGNGSSRPAAVRIPPASAPLLRHGLLRKHWRYVGVWGPALCLCAARVKVGPVRLPMITCLSLRHAGTTHELVDPLRGLRSSKADYGYFFWRFAHHDDRVAIEGEFSAEPEAFVALNYYNPPGGTKQCLNTKIASCTLTVTDRRTGRAERLSTAHRALFEILTDHRGHGIDVRA